MQKIKTMEKAANNEKPKNSRDFHFTSITVSLNKKNEKDSGYVPISSRRRGVAFSQKKDIKKLITHKMVLKKMQS